MLPAHGSRLLAAVVLSLAAVPARPADKNDFDKRWTQAEQNVRSGPGQQYFDNVFFKELSGKYAVHMTECAQRTGERLMVDLNAAVELGPHGQVMAILVRP